MAKETMAADIVVKQPLDWPCRHVNLQHFDRIGGHPDIQLPESGFQSFLEMNKELAACKHIFGVNKYSHQIITINLGLVLSHSADGLSLAGDSSKPFAQFHEGCSNHFIRYGLTVIEPERQEYFESPKRSAHKWPVLLRYMESLRRPGAIKMTLGPQ
jgi:hypothetical protein